MLDINFCEMMNPTSQFRGDDWEEQVRKIAALGQACGVRFTQSHLPYYDIWADNPPEKVTLMEELIRRAIWASAMLGVKWTVTHPGTYYAAGHDMRVSMEKNLEYYGRHVETARSAGIGIALENDFEYKVRPYQRIFCSSIPELIALVDAFDDPTHVGVCYDFGHANLTGGFHRQNLNLIGKRLRAVHVQDNRGVADEHLMPFYGNIDWPDAMAGLADIGFEGELTYEIQNFGQYVPNAHKHLVVEQSIAVGNILIGYYEAAKSAMH